ncbi:MAG: hypothetical protein COT14_01050 [Candidatus Diapherotrites archaeon CG08_land_8_20_14_0_20_30_16]|nr:MAG: hypothetical protein COT14_01050 [Candidatus Diapherotrites archaeon CG08_land_8_20_14_0_20_30_16]
MGIPSRLKYIVRSRLLDLKSRVTGKPKEVLQTENFVDRIRKRRTKFVTKSLAARFARDLPRTTDNMRTLDNYDLDMQKVGLPTVTETIKRLGKPNVKVLDACAGFGNVGKDLARLYPNTKGSKIKVKYDGVDIVSRDRVKGFDVVSDRLPRNTYDLIIEDFGFPYLIDKFRALENLCNALKVGGTLVIPYFGEFTVNGNLESLRYTFRSITRSFFTKGVYKKPHLSIRFAEYGGILITKLDDKETKFGLKYLGAHAQNPKAYYKALRNRKSDTGFILISNYSL